MLKADRKTSMGIIFGVIGLVVGVALGLPVGWCGVGGFVLGVIVG